MIHIDLSFSLDIPLFFFHSLVAINRRQAVSVGWYCSKYVHLFITGLQTGAPPSAASDTSLTIPYQLNLSIVPFTQLRERGSISIHDRLISPEVPFLLASIFFFFPLYTYIHGEPSPKTLSVCISSPMIPHIRMYIYKIL